MRRHRKMGGKVGKLKRFRTHVDRGRQTEEEGMREETSGGGPGLANESDSPPKDASDARAAVSRRHGGRSVALSYDIILSTVKTNLVIRQCREHSR